MVKSRIDLIGIFSSVILALSFGFPALSQVSTTVQTPSFSTGTGTYYAPVTLTMAESTAGSSIYYTTNGTTPTANSTLYTGPITITTTTKVEIVAINAGTSSAVNSATYTLTTPYAPSFSTGTGTYYAPPKVTIEEGTKCAVVYYTTNGTTPTTSSSVYTGPITISTTTTMQAMAECPGGSPSTVYSATYTLTTPYVPSFSTGTGTYYAPPTVAINEGTKCAVVYYTTNGTTPTTSSSVYSEPIIISSKTTLQAMAECPGGSPSAVDSATYTISAPYTPSFSTGSGTYYAPPTVTIYEATACAEVYYTTNGTTPTTSSSVYTVPLTISSTTTLQAMAECPGGSRSAVNSKTYTISTPTSLSFSTGTGTYYAPPTVTISELTKCAVIYYTTDGTTPTTSSTVYTSPLTISSTTTLQAISECPGGSPSAVHSATYTLSVPYTPSFGTGTGTYYAPPSVTINEGTKCAVVYYTTDGTTPTTSSTVYTVPLTISSTTTLQAISECPGGGQSAVASATYTLSAPYTPSFSTGTGTYYAPPTVAINEGTKCAVVYYTTNGTPPSTSSSVYAGPVTITSTTTLEAISECPGGGLSTVASATYTLLPSSAPTFGTASGTYEKSVTVTMNEAVAGAMIYYTADGTTPTTASAVYSGPVTFSNTSTFSSTVTVQAISVYPGGTPSPVTAASYTILSTSTPVNSANSTASFFGMNVISLLNGTPWPLVPVGTLRDMIEQTHWSTMNPSQGTYDFASLDQEISIAEANNAQFLYAFDDTPPWAIPTNVPITSLSRSGNVVTVTTSTPHGIYANPTYTPNEWDAITIAGVTDSSYNGTFALTGTPTPTTLTYAQTGPNSTSTAGTVSVVCGGRDAPGGCAEPPANLMYWDDYVIALINHVGPGVVQYWELWNEANIAETWRGNSQLLVSMASDARAIIKSVDPNAIILSPSTTIDLETPQECANLDPRCGSTWLSNWLAAGGAPLIDGVTFHGYPEVGPVPEQILGAVTLQQVAMNQNGVGSLPLWDTESSWEANTNLPAASDEVGFVGRHLLLEHSLGVQRSFWFAYDSTTWGTLWTSSTGLNSSGTAYQQVQKWIVGATLTQPCAATSADPTTFVCGYSRPNGYSALAIWNTTAAKSYTVPITMTQYHDLYGNIVPVSGGVVEIGTSPILVETSSAF
jgi:hypothetical protein